MLIESTQGREVAPVPDHQNMAIAKMHETGQLAKNWWMMDECWEYLQRLCDRFSDSSMVPYDYNGKPGNVLVALSAGLPLGLSPLACLQSVAVINGKPTLYGDAPIALILNRPDAKISETVTGTIEGEDRCHTMTVIRSFPDGTERTIQRSYSVADAKRAKLWNKRGNKGQDTPWITSPDRMLYARCRAFALRDSFADVLSGVSLAADVYEEGEQIEPAEFEVKADPSPPAVPDPGDVVTTGDGFEDEPPKKRKSRHTLKSPKGPRDGDTYGNHKKGEQIFVRCREAWVKAEDVTAEQAIELDVIVTDDDNEHLAKVFDELLEPVEDEQSNDAPDAPAEDPAPAAEGTPDPEPENQVAKARAQSKTDSPMLPDYALEPDLEGLVAEVTTAGSGKVSVSLFTKPWGAGQLPSGNDGDLAIRFLPGAANRPLISELVDGAWCNLSDEGIGRVRDSIRAAFSRANTDLCRALKIKPEKALAIARNEETIGEFDSWVDMSERQLMLVRALLTEHVRGQ